MVQRQSLTIIPILLVLVSALLPVSFTALAASTITITLQPPAEAYPVNEPITVVIEGLQVNTGYKICIVNGSADVVYIDPDTITGLKYYDIIPAIEEVCVQGITSDTTVSFVVTITKAGTYLISVRDVNDVELARKEFTVSGEATTLILHVKDASTNEPIVGAKVVVNGPGFEGVEYTTDENGDVVITGVIAGAAYTIKVEAVNYFSKEFTIVVGSYTEIPVYLQHIELPAKVGKIILEFLDAMTNETIVNRTIEVQITDERGKIVAVLYTTGGKTSEIELYEGRYNVRAFDLDLEYVGTIKSIYVKAGETQTVKVYLKENPLLQRIEQLSTDVETTKRLTGIATGLGVVGAIAAFYSLYKAQLDMANIKEVIDELKTSIENLRMELQKLREKLGEKVGLEEVKKLEEEISSLATRVGELEKSLAGLEESISAVRDAITAIQDTLAKYGDEITALKDQVSELRSTSTELSTKVSDLESALSELSTSLEQFRTSIDELRSKLATVMTALAGLQKDVESLKGTAAELTDWSSSAEKRLSSVESRVDELEKSVEELRTKITGIEKLAVTVDELKTTVQSLSNKITGLSTEISSLKTSTEQTSKDIKNLAGQLMVAYGVSIIGLLVAVVALVLIWRKITK